MLAGVDDLVVEIAPRLNGAHNRSDFHEVRSGADDEVDQWHI